MRIGPDSPLAIKLVALKSSGPAGLGDGEIP
jgi:hypothetical protein